MHFDYMPSDLHRAEYMPKLDGYFKKLGAGKYEKNREDIYDLLRSRLKVAIAYAEKLEEYHGPGASPSANTPGTAVYKIFKHLKPYLSL